MCSVSAPSMPPPPAPLPPPEDPSAIQFGGVSLRRRKAARGRDSLRTGGLRSKKTKPSAQRVVGTERFTPQDAMRESINIARGKGTSRIVSNVQNKRKQATRTE